MNSEIIVGLDIGTTKIACFVGQAIEGGKLKILGYGKTESIGVERGVVRNIKNTAESIQKAVEEASNQANVDIREVYVGIAGQHIKSMQNRGSIMIPQTHKIIEEEDVQRLINDQKNIMLSPGEEIIHILPQCFYVDGEELSVDPVGVSGNCLEANFHIVTGNTINLRNIQESVIRAGLTVKGVVLEPIASAEAVLDNRDKDAGVALIDIGGGTTDIAIFESGVIRHTAVIPMAGNLITEDIREGCTILKAQAETLKIRFGSCLPQMVSEDDIISIPGIRNQPSREISMKTLAGIIHARTQLILEQVAREIQLSGFDKKLIGGVVLTGGGSKLRYIEQLTSYVTAIDTRLGLPNEHLSNDAPEEIIHPMYATGIGLVLYGIKETENKKAKRYEHVDNCTQAEKGTDEIHHEKTEKVEKENNIEDISKKGGKPKLFDAVTAWINKAFTEDIDNQ